MSNQSLKARFDEIMEVMKENHPSVYQWFIDRRIDYDNISKYTANIASAAALVAATSTAPAEKAMPPIQKPTAEVKVIEKSELRGKTDAERAKLVWERYGTIIHKTAKKYDLDPNLIFATIMIESGGDAYAIRHEPRINDASYGLGQMLYSTARGIGFTGAPSELFDPEVNIDLIGKYHRRNLDHYKDLTPEQLTIAYNTGSPYKKPWPGHLTKFEKWYNRASNIEMDLS